MKVTDFDIVGRIDTGTGVPGTLRNQRDVYRCNQCRALILGSDIPIDPKNDLVLHVKWHQLLESGTQATSTARMKQLEEDVGNLDLWADNAGYVHVTATANKRATW